jgi:hypothetical protein
MGFRVKHLHFSIFLLLPSVAACGVGSASTSTPPPFPQIATAPSGTLSEAQSDARYEASAQAPLASSNPDLLYIGNTGNNSITVYRHDAAGNTTPIYVIGGSRTGIGHPGQLSEDAQGNLYVASGASILVFPHGAHGNAAPIRTIAGPSTGIHNVTAMTVDKATGKIFVADAFPQGSFYNVSLLRFPPNANGNVAPFAHSASDANGAFMLIANQLASDSTGRNLIESTLPNSISSYYNGYGLATLGKQFSNDAPLNLIYGINQFVAGGVADDPTTKTYLTTNGRGIYRLPENAVGRGPDTPLGAAGQAYTPALVSVITSDACASALAVAPGPAPYTYALHSSLNGGCPTDAVYVYKNNASGNTAPLRILSGSLTKMNKPSGIYEGP